MTSTPDIRPDTTPKETTMGEQIYTFLYIGLLFTCCCPNISTFYDEWTTPKWFFAGLTACAIALWYSLTSLCKRPLFHGLQDKIPVRHLYIFSMAFTMVAVVESIFTLFLFATEERAFYLGSAGSFDNPAGVAFFLCSSLPFICLWRKNSDLPFRKALFLSALILIIIAILSTRSRTGILCLIIYIILYGYARIRCSRWIKYTALCIAISGTISWVLSRKQDSTSGRLFILERTWELICEKPWTGQGIGGFKREYMLRQADFFHEHPTSEYITLADETWHPLNEFTSLWVDFGIAGPLLLFMLLSYVPLVLYHKQNTTLRILASTFIPLWMFSLFSYPFKYPAAWLILLVGLAYSTKIKQKIQTYCPSVTRILSACILLASLSISAYLFWEHKYEKEWTATSRRALRGYSKEVMPHYDRLYRHYQDDPLFLYNYAYELFNADRSQNALTIAEACRTHWSSYNLELLTGDICRDLTKYTKALIHYQTAYDMCPVRFAPLEGLYYTYKNMGDTTKADSIALIVQKKPVKVPSYDIERIKSEIAPQSSFSYKK